MLYVVTRSPFPPWRGDQLRSYHLLRHLARRHEITLVVAGTHPSGSALSAVAALGVQVRSLGSPHWRAGVRMARGVLGDRRPFQVLPYTGNAAVREVAELAAEHDLVHAHLLRAIPMVPDHEPLVVDLVDALSLNLTRRSEHDRGVRRWAARWEASRLGRYEESIITRSRATVVATDEDAAHLGGRSVVIPNGVDFGEFWLRNAGRTAPTLGFAGNLGYFPNVDAARTLVTEVLPGVRRSVPEARALLAGTRPARAVRRLAGADVTLVTDPPDIGGVIASAAVAVMPMRAGTGIQNKVLEAMAVGTPVVTTARVADAVGAVDGTHLLVADGVPATVDATVRLLTDRGLGAELRRQARAFVEEHFSWEQAAVAMERVWQGALR